MKLKAKERQTGAYGTVNAGDIITVTDEYGQALLDAGHFEETTDDADTATPEQVMERNASGLVTEPVHADGTDREILNTTGRKIHESGEGLEAESAAREAAGVEANGEDKDALPPVTVTEEVKSKPKKA